jgi:hypothetical protein
MTPKQEKFAQCVADGMTQADAYRTAFDVRANTKPETIVANASRLMADSNVSARVNELKTQLSAKALWTREMSVAALQDVLYNPDRQSDKIAAVKELNLMHGYNEPIKHEVTGKDGAALIPAPVYKIVKE